MRTSIHGDAFHAACRSIRLSNPKVQQTVVGVPGAVEFLEAAGGLQWWNSWSAGSVAMGYGAQLGG